MKLSELIKELSAISTSLQTDPEVHVYDPVNEETENRAIIRVRYDDLMEDVYIKISESPAIDGEDDGEATVNND